MALNFELVIPDEITQCSEIHAAPPIDLVLVTVVTLLT